MRDNPKPKIWRSDNIFVVLNEVAAIHKYTQTVGVTLMGNRMEITLKNGSKIDRSWNDQTVRDKLFQSLSDALEMYYYE